MAPAGQAPAGRASAARPALQAALPLTKSSSLPPAPSALTLQHLLEVLRKAKLDNRLLEFFPQQVRTARSARSLGKRRRPALPALRLMPGEAWRSWLCACCRCNRLPVPAAAFPWPSP